MNWKRLEVFFEFLVFGIIVGVAEDLIAIEIVTNEPITWQVVGIIVLIAIPFALLGEVLVDRIDFVELFKKYFGKKIENSLKKERRCPMIFVFIHNLAGFEHKSGHTKRIKGAIRTAIVDNVPMMKDRQKDIRFFCPQNPSATYNGSSISIKVKVFQNDLIIEGNLAREIAIAFSVATLRDLRSGHKIQVCVRRNTCVLCEWKQE
ncbi:MAG TPA: hypothetical protein VJ378_02560 [Candidatus Paceibacterota bacterium]|nr:hypothetical protein [Candidatus Paceibacterota bacterium]